MSDNFKLSNNKPRHMYFELFATAIAIAIVGTMVRRSRHIQHSQKRLISLVGRYESQDDQVGNNCRHARPTVMKSLDDVYFESAMLKDQTQSPSSSSSPSPSRLSDSSLSLNCDQESRPASPAESIDLVFSPVVEISEISGAGDDVERGAAVDDLIESKPIEDLNT